MSREPERLQIDPSRGGFRSDVTLVKARWITLIFNVSLAVAAAMAAHVGVLAHVIRTNDEVHRRLTTFHAAAAIYLALLPAAKLVLFDAFHSEEDVVGHRSRVLSWGSLITIWLGTLVVIGACFAGKISAGFCFVAAWRPECRSPVVVLGFGVLLVSLGCVLEGLPQRRQSRILGQQPKSAVSLQRDLCSMYVVVQLLVLPIQAILVALLAFAPLRVHWSWAEFLNDPTFTHRLFWFALQPVLLAALWPIAGFVGASLEKLTGRLQNWRLVWHAVIAYATVSFVTSGIHDTGVGQSARLSVLSAAACALLLIPASLPFFLWLGQLRQIPSESRRQSRAVLVVIILLAACMLSALPLTMPTSVAVVAAHWLQLSCLHLLVAVLAIVAYTLKEWSRVVRVPTP